MSLIFFKVKATDADEGTNAEIEYSIVEPQSSEVKNIFGINQQTGGIYLIKSAVPYENKLYQFLVKAEDRGTPSRHADVPVGVYIMGPQDVAPMFETKDDKFFMSENAPAGLYSEKIFINFLIN